MSSIEEDVQERDVETELREVLRKVGPDLQDAIKRGFTNIAIQQTKNGENTSPETIEDVSYSSKNTQVNLQRLELAKRPSFHATRVSLSLQSLTLQIRCSLGELFIRGLYSAFNENMYNLIPVMSEGHMQVAVSNVCAEVNSSLTIREDGLELINPVVEFTHDEALVKLTWPSPQRNGGYDFTTTEQLTKHMDELPLTAALSRPLDVLLRQRLLDHVRLVLRETTGVSDMLGCDDALVHRYRSDTELVTTRGNRAMDVLLMNVRRTLLQGAREVLKIPSLHACFTHRIGPLSFIGKMETDSGWLKNIATIDRANDVTVTTGPAKTTLSVLLNISDLKLGYNEYRIRLMGGCRSGRVLVGVEDNSLLLAVSAGVDRGQHYAQLEQLTVQSFDRLDVHVTGLGPLSGLAGGGGAVRAWLAGHVTAHVLPLLLRHVAAEVQRAFADHDLWDLTTL